MSRIKRLRKKFFKISIFAAVTRALFRHQKHTKMLFISQIIDLYNHYINEIDRGDQIKTLAQRQRSVKG